MKIELDRDERRRLIQGVQKFFSEVRDEEIGILAADRVVDFFIENMGAALYNAALDRARVWFNQALGNLEVDYDQLYRSIEGPGGEPGQGRRHTSHGSR